MKKTSRKKRKLLVALAVLVVLGAIVGGIAWQKLLRVHPQDPEVLASADMKFKYGSLGAENDRGLPYLVWMVLPRIFPEMMPGPGGYKSFGLVWEEGQEVPVGFAKKTVGFPRLTNNCALCHTATWRAGEDAPVHVVPAGPGHTVRVQAMMRFLSRAAADPRFNADTILREIDLVSSDTWGNGGLSWLDRLIYRYGIIPLTRKALIEQEETLAWMNRPGKPHWGPGRDDPMNLTKYFMTDMPEDDTVGQADFPSIWNLGVRSGTDSRGEALLLNWSGDTPAVRSVLIDSALGLGAPAEDWFLEEMAELDRWLSELPPPRWPDEFPPPDPALVAAGEPIFEQNCAVCHEPGRERTNKVIPIEEIGTDPERMHSWSAAAARHANEKVSEAGIDRPPMTQDRDPYGYIAPPLDGLWLRAPYLHNGSIPNLTEFFKPPGQRVKQFHRGYDVYDPQNVGFVTDHRAEAAGAFLLDTTERGNGNGGHLIGTTLAPDQKRALIEYLKTR